MLTNRNSAPIPVVASASGRGESPRAVIWCVILLVALVGAFHDTLSAMMSTWLNTTTYNHGFLILPTALYLIWIRRRELAQFEPQQEAWALVPLAGGASFWLVSAAAEVTTFQEIALIGMALAVVLFCFGWPIGKRFAFPLLFLFFMVPIGDFLIPPLQAFTGGASVVLLQLSGVPVYHDGNLIQIPSGAFLVAEACAGLRFLIANVVVASLFSYLAYTKWWKRCVFMIIAIIVPVLANAIRAFGIIYLAYFTDNRTAAGADHIIYGWGFFSLVMIVLLAIGSTFGDRSRGRERLQESTERSHGHRRARPKQWRHVLAVTAAVIMISAPAYVQALMGPPIGASDHRSAVTAVNSTWFRLPAADPDWRPQFPGADWTLRDIYRRGEDEVDVFVAYYEYQRRGSEVVYYANRMADDKTWFSYDAAIEVVHLRTGLVAARTDDLASSADHRIVIWWYWVDGQLTESAMRAKLLELAARLFGGNQAAAVIAVSVKYDGDRSEAMGTVERFLRESAPVDAYLEVLSRR